MSGRNDRRHQPRLDSFPEKERWGACNVQGAVAEEWEMAEDAFEKARCEYRAVQPAGLGERFGARGLSKERFAFVQSFWAEERAALIARNGGAVDGKIIASVENIREAVEGTLDVARALWRGRSGALARALWRSGAGALALWRGRSGALARALWRGKAGREVDQLAGAMRGRRLASRAGRRARRLEGVAAVRARLHRAQKRFLRVAGRIYRDPSRALRVLEETFLALLLRPRRAGWDRATADPAGYDVQAPEERRAFAEKIGALDERPERLGRLRGTEVFGVRGSSRERARKAASERLPAAAEGYLRLLVEVRGAEEENRRQTAQHLRRASSRDADFR